MSISDKITQLTTIRSDIRTALTDKGIDASEHNFKDFAGDIRKARTNDYVFADVPFKCQSYDFSDITKFQKVSYIESTGGAYIDVDFSRNGSANISCEMEIEPFTSPTGNYAVFGGFGVDFAHSGGSCTLQQYLNNKWALLEPGISYHEFGSLSTQKYNITLSLSGTTATLSGDISSSVTSSNYSTSATFNNEKSRIAYSGFGSALRATKYKFKREGIVECSLFACYHIPTGIVGFYDEINRVFYINNGGTFTKGVDLN